MPRASREPIRNGLRAPDTLALVTFLLVIHLIDQSPCQFTRIRADYSFDISIHWKKGAGIRTYSLDLDAHVISVAQHDLRVPHMTDGEFVEPLLEDTAIGREHPASG
jgi:hypothetical protein